MVRLSEMLHLHSSRIRAFPELFVHAADRAEHLGDTAEKWRQEKLGMSKAEFHSVEKAK
jgi:hypothetical protein